MLLLVSSFLYLLGGDGQEGLGEALHTRIVLRCDGHQFSFHVIADVQCLYEGMDGLLCHLLIGARERFQRLIRVRVGFAAQDGLYGFSHYSPCVLQVFVQFLLVEDQLSQAFQRALNGDDTMSEGYTYVAQHRRVGEVALQTAYRQFLSQELQDGIGNAKVAF